MKLNSGLGVLTAAWLATHCSFASAPGARSAPVSFNWSNPLPFRYSEGQTVPRSEVRDPCLVREGDKFYLLFTMWPFRNREESRLSEPNQGGSPGIALYSSRDLRQWRFETWLVKSSELPADCPYKNRFWAPEIHKLKGRYYLIFTADNWLKKEYNPAGTWGMAGYAFVGVADSVAGPYQHITYIEGAACDTSLFEDSDGRTYAIIPRRQIDVQEIDLTGVTHGRVRLLGKPRRAVTSENDDIRLKPSPEYLEGPWLQKIHGKYCLFYAAIHRDQHYPDWLGYWTSVAYADTIAGPWKKDPRGKLFKGGHLTTFVDLDGGSWFCYRGESMDAAHGLLAVDPFRLGSDNSVETRAPSIGPSAEIREVK